ncbi:hypothetical protein [Streptomyces sp. NBC_00878]|uniref:hypothetical protein n=1 Tax=Streptomyces sp. NBC_00878 TaxID=2975854 RepID=UPI002255E325|nr:hypothetical protein [Streptomyces sp. NBC_00878]MCX4911851.1 hypothetical protein [Streptomyces sp. NBC_00878]
MSHMKGPGPQPCCDAQAERDQYAAASRHLAYRIRHTAYIWATTLPETIRTADVVEALSGMASHVPDRPELRDDLWMRIAGAYEARFENDGHPEDARHAADEAMSVVQPVITELKDSREAAEKRLQAVTEAVILWRDRPGGDIGLAIALAGILDIEQPEPPASAALVRVLRECDRIERAVQGNPTTPDFDGAYLACIGHIREAAGPVQVETDPRQSAYDAVLAYIRQQPVDFMPTTVVDRNAMIWDVVHAALDAVGVPEPGTQLKED